MKIEVAIFFVDSVNRYFAYVDNVRVGYILRSRGDWNFTADSSGHNIFPPPQLAAIHEACHARAALLNLTARMLK